MGTATAATTATDDPVWSATVPLPVPRPGSAGASGAELAVPSGHDREDVR
ncbi:hypothetical protein [Kitasatospora sp. NPDC017646]